MQLRFLQHTTGFLLWGVPGSHCQCVIRHRYVCIVFFVCPDRVKQVDVMTYTFFLMQLHWADDIISAHLIVWRSCVILETSWY